MHGFKTSRALIIDDEPQEALPIVHALGAIGIASLYHDAHPDADYSKKHSGIRLLLLDMVLKNRGANADDAVGAANTLVTALEQLIEKTSDPLVVVIWTKHGDFRQDFEKAFIRAFPKTPLADVLIFNKDDLSAPDKRSALINELRKAFDKLRPVSLLFGWEQVVHDAATQTTSALAGLIQLSSSNAKIGWGKAAYQICAALALAERGSRLVGEDGNQAVKAFFDALNPILLDRLDHHNTNDNPDLKEIALSLASAVKEEQSQWEKGYNSAKQIEKREEALKLIRENLSSQIPPEQIDRIPSVKLEPVSLLTEDLISRLQTMIHVSRNVTQGDVCPGTVYFMEREKENRKLVTEGFLPWTELCDEIFFQYPGKLPPNHFPALVEISAICDYAQGKVKIPKFIAGVFTPRQSELSRKYSNYVREVGPVFLENEAGPKLEGVYVLVINAHFIVSLKRDTAQNLKPTMRLRTPILSELIAWSASHMGRPGAVHVGP